MFNLKKKYPFIKNLESSKLMLLEFLLEYQPITIDDISERFELSYRTTKNLLNDLTRELYDYEPTVKIIDNSKFVSLIDTSYLEYLKFFTKLKIKYYEDSVIFKLIMYLLKKNKCSIYNLSAQFHISYSYVYKVLAEANLEFETQNIAVSFKVTKNQVSLLGLEKNIRVMYYFFCIVVFDTQYSELKPIVTQKKTFYFKPFSLATKHKIELIIQIHISRESKSYMNLEFTDSELFFLDLLIEKVKKNIDSPYINKSNEEQGLYLWLVFCTPELLSDFEKKIIGQTLLENKFNTPILTLFIDLISHLCTKFHVLNKSSLTTLLFEFFLTYLVYSIFDYHYFKFPYKHNYEISSSYNDLANELTNYLCNYISDEYLNELVLDFTDLSFAYFSVVNPINIYVEFSDYSRRKFLVQTYIKQNYSENAVQIVDNILNADLIVSNTIPAEPIQIDYFYFTGMDSRFNWSELGQSIQSKILQKYMDVS